MDPLSVSQQADTGRAVVLQDPGLSGYQPPARDYDAQFRAEREREQQRQKAGQPDFNFGTAWERDLSDLEELRQGTINQYTQWYQERKDPTKIGTEEYRRGQQMQNFTKDQYLRSSQHKAYYEDAVKKYTQNPGKYTDESVQALEEWKNTPIYDRGTPPLLEEKFDRTAYIKDVMKTYDPQTVTGQSTVETIGEGDEAVRELVHPKYKTNTRAQIDDAAQNMLSNPDYLKDTQRKISGMDEAEFNTMQKQATNSGYKSVEELIAHQDAENHKFYEDHTHKGRIPDGKSGFSAGEQADIQLNDTLLTTVSGLKNANPTLFDKESDEFLTSGGAKYKTSQSLSGQVLGSYNPIQEPGKPAPKPQKNIIEQFLMDPSTNEVYYVTSESRDKARKQGGSPLVKMGNGFTDIVQPVAENSKEYDNKYILASLINRGHDVQNQQFYENWTDSYLERNTLEENKAAAQKKYNEQQQVIDGIRSSMVIANEKGLEDLSTDEERELVSAINSAKGQSIMIDGELYTNIKIDWEDEGGPVSGNEIRIMGTNKEGEEVPVKKGVFGIEEYFEAKDVIKLMTETSSKNGLRIDPEVEAAKDGKKTPASQQPEQPTETPTDKWSQYKR